MPVIYYYKYEPLSDSVREISLQEHVLGRELLFRGLRELYQLSFDPRDKEEAIACDQNGKPYLKDHPDIFFNITHCSGLVACAFDDRPIGIDAEPVGYFPEVLIRRALSDPEKTLLASYGTTEDRRQKCFWRFWTLKEAYVKKSGIGVDSDLRSFSFSFDPYKDLIAGDPVSVDCSDPAVSCCQLMTESGHILSVCTADVPGSLVCDVIEYVDLSHQIDEDHNSEHHPHG